MAGRAAERYKKSPRALERYTETKVDAESVMILDEGAKGHKRDRDRNCVECVAMVANVSVARCDCRM